MKKRRSKGVPQTRVRFPLLQRCLGLLSVSAASHIERSAVERSGSRGCLTSRLSRGVGGASTTRSQRSQEQTVEVKEGKSIKIFKHQPGPSVSCGGSIYMLKKTRKTENPDSE